MFSLFMCRLIAGLCVVDTNGELLSTEKSGLGQNNNKWKESGLHCCAFG